MNLEMENGVLIFVSAIFNIFLVTVMALVSIIIAVSYGLKYELIFLTLSIR